VCLLFSVTPPLPAPSHRVWVTPDYLSIGSDTDYLRFPLSPYAGYNHHHHQTTHPPPTPHSPPLHALLLPPLFFFFSFLLFFFFVPFPPSPPLPLSQSLGAPRLLINWE